MTRPFRFFAYAFGVVLTMLISACNAAGGFLLQPLVTAAREVGRHTVIVFRAARAPLVFILLFGAVVAFAAGKTITLTSTGVSACTATDSTGLGLTKTWQIQCAGQKMRIRRACATPNASCQLDAGVGDQIYDFNLYAPSVRDAPPLELHLRSTETRICAQATDAGAFTCYLNEDAPF